MIFQSIQLTGWSCPEQSPFPFQSLRIKSPGDQILSVGFGHSLGSGWVFESLRPDFRHGLGRRVDDISILPEEQFYLPFREMENEGKGFGYRMSSAPPAMKIILLQIVAEVISGVPFTIRTLYITARCRRAKAEGGSLTQVRGYSELTSGGSKGMTGSGSSSVLWNARPSS